MRRLRSFKVRQKRLGVIDEKFMEGEYWAWFYHERSFPWLPRGEEGYSTWHQSVQQNNRHLIPDGHAWVSNNHFQVPLPWLTEHRRNSPAGPTKDKLRRYSIALAKCPGDIEPLPHEKEETYIARQQENGITPTMEQLRYVYSLWKTNPAYYLITVPETD